MISTVALRSLLDLGLDEVDRVRLIGGTKDSIRYVPVLVKGNDREKFLQGQTTNDIYKLKMGESHLTSRIDVKGKIKSFFFLKRCQDHCLLLVPAERLVATLEDLGRYIIMDDVELSSLQETPALFLGALSALPPLEPTFNADASISLDFMEIPGLVVWGEKNLLLFKRVASDHAWKISEEVMEKLRILSGLPQWGEDINEGTGLSESFLEKGTVDYDKGCFLGQEVLAKIHHNRGPSYFPVVLVPVAADSPPEGDFYLPLLGENFIIEEDRGGTLTHLTTYKGNVILRGRLFRNFRIEGRTFILHFSKGNTNFPVQVRYLPFLPGGGKFGLATELIDMAYQLYTFQHRPEEAIILLQASLLLWPSHAEAHETLAVILGKIERFEEAIGILKNLVVLDPRSVMAHTNLSLFYMKLGRIEEAEQEKALATTKTFDQFAGEHLDRKLQEKQQQKAEEDWSQSEKLFRQVLEIDIEDALANYGLGDLMLKKGRYQEAVVLLERSLESNPKHSAAYMSLGKSYEGMGDIERAKKIYLKGISAAASQGQLNPANDMQARLNLLS